MSEVSKERLERLILNMRREAGEVEEFSGPHSIEADILACLLDYQSRRAKEAAIAAEAEGK